MCKNCQCTLTIQQSYGLGLDAVQGPVGSRLAIYDLGGWSLSQFLGPSSDSAWYRGPGWQEAWPQ